jgi:hypothetical protein
VYLSQSPPYSMKKADDQAKVYRLLAKLLWFLGSGQSHVGYLSNCLGSPFAAVVAAVVHSYYNY